MSEVSGIDPSILTFEGCQCKNCEDNSLCGCMKRFEFLNYIKTGSKDSIIMKLNYKMFQSNSPPIFECNTMCKCSLKCSNRLVQHGIGVPLEVDYDEVKGSIVRPLRQIEQYEFVCQYAGEVLTLTEARSRTNLRPKNSMNYIIVVKEHLAFEKDVFTSVIDPRLRGNVGRFINHSCDSNLKMLPVRCDSDIPMLALFAKHIIGIGDELTFDYGDDQTVESINSTQESNHQLKRCECKSDNCKGYLPFNPDLLDIIN